MRTGSKLIIAALAVAAASVTTAAFAFEEGSVSIAFADGYMGTDHQFHAWEHRADAEQFRAKHADMYRAWRHDDPRHHEGQ
jgi:hypothetical protein